MKKNGSGGLARLTAGCLPVPLFHQKKRVRQPFTSSPGSAAETPELPAEPADLVWEMTRAQVPPFKKMMDAGHREESTKAQDRNEFALQRKSLCGPSAGQATLERTQKQRQSDRAQGAGAQGLGNSSSSWHVVKCTSQPSHLKRTFDNGPEEKVTKEVPGCQLMMKEDDLSLRILPAVIESMKHWRERLPCYPLLFEVLAVLDSAVTSGAYGAKTFLLRDGKNTVPGVFYEIDRELPRLIRGRVHRCVGSFDLKTGLLQCVSVRPASASEQRTFRDFVKTADARMSYYASARSEM